VISDLIAATDAGRTVLVPNAELAAALFDALERAQRDAGLGVWPTPRVRDFGGWLRERHGARHLADSSVPRCLTEVEERELWRRVVLESGCELLEPAGAARAARRARRAIYEYGIPPRAIAAHATEEAATFLEWNARFDAACRAHHCVSADELLTLAEQPDLFCARGSEPIAWIESPHWRPVARRWLEHHAGAALRAEVACGVSAAGVALEDGTPVGAARVQAASSPAAELAAIADWAREQLRAHPGFRAWICVPDLSSRRAEIVDALDAALAPQRFALRDTEIAAPYAIAGGTALADYPPVRAALDLLSAAAGSVLFEEWSALLRAPELAQSMAEAASAARLDVMLRSRAPSEAALGHWLALAESVARGAGLEPPAPLLRLEAASRALERLSGSQPVSHWVPVWVAAFEAGPWTGRDRWSSTEYQAAERFRELMAALASADPIFGSRPRRSAEDILRRAARDTAFQPQTGVPPIWVSGQLLDPWLSYEGLWVSGCDVERWPAPVDPVPLLPVRLQRAYGVSASGADLQLKFAEDLQSRWLSRAPRCIFSYADRGDGHAAAPSALLARVASTAPPQARRSSRAGSQPWSGAAASTEESEPEPHWRAQRRAAPALERLIDAHGPAFGPDEETRGVSTLRAQARCPFRAFAETRLRTDSLERPHPGFNDRERGELVHDALRRIWSEARDSAGLAAIAAREGALERLLEESIGQSLGRLCRQRDPGKRWRRREQRRLVGLLGKWLQLERARPPFEVEHCEEGAESAVHAGLEFTMRIDRIDRLPDGARVLIDYKTGAAGPDWRGERPDNPQLPLYALGRRQGLIAVAYGRINAARCEFVVESERAGIFPGRRASKLEGQASFAALIEVWSSRIERLAQDFAQGRAQVDPTVSACRTCSLEGLCRIPSTLPLGERSEA